MYGSRVVRRWQRWAWLAVGIILGAWLLLAAPCALLSCPTRDTADDFLATADDASKRNHEEAHRLCSSLPLAPTTRHLETTGSPQLGSGGPYQVVYDWIPRSSSYEVNDSVTYTTHTTPEMMHHVAELAQRWTGPISVAVYVPHTDYCLAASKIARMRVCGPKQVRELVSWHIYWPREAPPAQEWHLLVNEEALDCTEPEIVIKGYRTSRSLAYPVNVARNVARTSAPTWFVLPSDVELYPSAGLPENFLEMAHRVTKGIDGEGRVAAVWPRVYVVPVFEVMTTVPQEKEELVRQYLRKEACYFHKNVCAHCQKFPALTDWIRHPGSVGKIQSFSVVKRQFPFHRWEPIYICTKGEPLYDERLSWEGLQDKMSQMHEVCLLDYNLVILDRAFLVHAPGIKRRTKKTAQENAWRDTFVTNNSKAYDKITNEMEAKYGKSARCKANK